MRAVVHLQRAPAGDAEPGSPNIGRQVLGVEAERLDDEVGGHGEAAAGDGLDLLAAGGVGQAEMHARWRARRSTWPSPTKASGAESQAKRTPSSSAFFTSRMEPGMLALSRR